MSCGIEKFAYKRPDFWPLSSLQSKVLQIKDESFRHPCPLRRRCFRRRHRQRGHCHVQLRCP